MSTPLPHCELRLNFRKTLAPGAGDFRIWHEVPDPQRATTVLKTRPPDPERNSPSAGGVFGCPGLSCKRKDTLPGEWVVSYKTYAADSRNRKSWHSLSGATHMSKHFSISGLFDVLCLAVVMTACSGRSFL